MLVQGFATDGGAHPPEKYAYWAAQAIGGLIKIDPSSQSEEAKRARWEHPRFVLAVQDAVETHHAGVVMYERAKLAEDTAHLSSSLDPRQHESHADALDEAVDAVTACAEGTLFEPHFKTDTTRDAVKAIIGSWFATAMDVERDWVAKGHMIGNDHRAAPNPDHDHRDPHAVAWLARRAGKAA